MFVRREGNVAPRRGAKIERVESRRGGDVGAEGGGLEETRTRWMGSSPKRSGLEPVDAQSCVSGYAALPVGPESYGRPRRDGVAQIFLSAKKRV